MHIERELEVRTDREAFFEVLLDVERHPRLAPLLSGAQVLARAPDTVDTAFQVRLLPGRAYAVRLRREPEGVAWELLSGTGESTHRAYGSWRIVGERGGRLLTCFEAQFELGVPVPAWFVSWLLRASLPRLLGDYACAMAAASSTSRSLS